MGTETFLSLSDRFGRWKTILGLVFAVIAGMYSAGTVAVKAWAAFDGQYVHVADAKKQQDRTDFQVNDLKLQSLKTQRQLSRDKKFDLEEKCRTLPAQCSAPVRQRATELGDEIAELTGTIKALGGQ